MVRRAAASNENDFIGSSFNRGTNMHVIPMETQSADEQLAIATGSSSWIVAAVLGAILIGEIHFRSDFRSKYISSHVGCSCCS